MTLGLIQCTRKGKKIMFLARLPKMLLQSKQLYFEIRGCAGTPTARSLFTTLTNNNARFLNCSVL
jgi:hypothetical protein